MQRSNTWIWLLLVALLLLAPGPLGRFVLDLVGGLTLALLLLPLLLGAAGFVAWQVIQRRLRTCPACGFTSMAIDSCPACGTSFGDTFVPRLLPINSMSATSPSTLRSWRTTESRCRMDAGLIPIQVRASSSSRRSLR